MEHVWFVTLPQGYMALHSYAFQVGFIASLTFLLKTSKEGKHQSQLCDKWVIDISQENGEKKYFSFNLE